MKSSFRYIHEGFADWGAAGILPPPEFWSKQ